MKNSINEMQNELASFGNRTDHLEEISNIEDRNLEMTQVEEEN